MLLYIHLFYLFQLLGHLLLIAKKVAEKEKLSNGYRIGKTNK
jgi:hypothetical protein